MDNHQKDSQCCNSGRMHPFMNTPYLPQIKDLARWPEPPDDAFCFALWDKYEMLENVRAHSLMVAHIATEMASRAKKLGMGVDVEAVRASGLLHDLAKTWCLLYGGSHAILGASWTMDETRHGGIAQGVLLHVHWPWKLPEGPSICSLPFFVMYADKRVRHDACVTLEERFEDLLKRYGKTEDARMGIRKSWEQSKIIEKLFSKALEWDLDEHNFNCGRLVN